MLYGKQSNSLTLIFENNSIEFPQRDLALFDLAKTYEILGRKEDAITWYKKVLTVNPGYEEAKNRLKDLEGNH